jgi:mannitol 2-dehydrogenase
MFECIVPASGPKELVLVLTFGTYDTEAVSHENFCAGCPDWDKVGPTFTGYSYYTTVGWFRGPGHDLQTDSYR